MDSWIQSMCFCHPRGQLSVFFEPEGHFSRCFCLLKEHFNMHFASQEDTIVCVLAANKWATTTPAPLPMHTTEQRCNYMCIFLQNSLLLIPVHFIFTLYYSSMRVLLWRLWPEVILINSGLTLIRDYKTSCSPAVLVSALKETALTAFTTNGKPHHIYMFQSYSCFPQQ